MALTGAIATGVATAAALMMTVREGVMVGAARLIEGESKDGAAREGAPRESPGVNAGRPMDGTTDTEPGREIIVCACANGWRVKIRASEALMVFMRKILTP
jgi:hypothetical protein